MDYVNLVNENNSPFSLTLTPCLFHSPLCLGKLVECCISSLFAGDLPRLDIQLQLCSGQIYRVRFSLSPEIYLIKEGECKVCSLILSSSPWHYVIYSSYWIAMFLP